MCVCLCVCPLLQQMPMHEYQSQAATRRPGFSSWCLFKFALGIREHHYTKLHQIQVITPSNKDNSNNYSGSGHWLTVSYMTDHSFTQEHGHFIKRQDNKMRLTNQTHLKLLLTTCAHIPPVHIVLLINVTALWRHILFHWHTDSSISTSCSL